MQRRQYRNPPIKEAVCEFRFSPDDDWDLTLPGLFHEKIKSEYSAKPREVSTIGVGFQVGVIPEHRVLKAPPAPPPGAKVQFLTADERRIVGIGPSLLSISVLQPYSRWEDFRENIESALMTYHEVAQPSGVQRIGLRYINQIVLEGGNIELTDYFTYAPDMATEELSVKMIGVYSRIMAKYEDQPIKLLTSFASTDAPEGHLGFLLDLDVIWEAEGEKLLSIENAMAMVGDMRVRERTAFESLITNGCREVFDAEA